MTKDAYYFSHDSNARHDPKILELTADYGMEGYGRWWVLIEILREEDAYKLPYSRRGWNAFATQAQCDVDTAHQFIDELINVYGLLSSDGEWFWSESLIRRMARYDERSEKARQSALKRWEICERNATAMPTQCDPHASKVKESKVKQSRVEEKPPPLDATTSSCLAVLQGVDNYPYDAKKDVPMLTEFRQDYPSLHILDELRGWRNYKRDHPLKPKGSPRAQLRTWMKKALEFKARDGARSSTAADKGDAALAILKAQGVVR